MSDSITAPAPLDFADLPEYSFSLPTWSLNPDASLCGCKRWKRRTFTRVDGRSYPSGWLLGEARIEGTGVHIDWTRIGVPA